MILGIILCAVGQLTFFIYTGFLSSGGSLNQEIVALFVGLSIIGLLLSVASIFLNYSRIKSGSRTHGVIGLVFSILGLVIYVSYLVTWYLNNIKAGGGRFLIDYLELLNYLL